MEIPIISIGNSKGLRLSKTILEKYKIRDKVELVLEKGYIIIKPIVQPRKGWEEAFQAMHEAEEDTLLMPDVFEEDTVNEWE